MLPIPLDGDLRLEMVSPRHAEPLFEAVDRNRTHLTRWLPFVAKSRGVEDSRRFIEKATRQWAENASSHLVILRGENVVGMVGFHPIDWENRVGTLGYWLTAQEQGRGTVTQACRALVQGGFGTLGLARIEIRCAVGNVRSRAVARRLGFAEEGVLRSAEKLSDGRRVDHVLYACLSEEWRG